MAKTNTSRGRLSGDLANALSQLASQGQSIFTVKQFATAVSRPAPQVWRTLTFLVARGWVSRLVRGKYLIVPLEAGPESAWSEDSLVIASHLASPAAISYWSACHYWNWTEQVSRTVFVQTTQRVRRGNQRVLGVTYRFIRIQPGKFFGLAERSSASGARLTVTDREKTLVDAVDHPELCGGIRQVAEMLPAIEQIDWAKAEQYLARLKSGAAYKRLGLLAETLGKKVQVPDRERRIESWRARLTGGYAPLEPGGPATGPVNNRWHVRLNVSGVADAGGEK